MKKFIVTYENKESQFLMYERILVHAEDYHDARKKATKWLSDQNFRSGKILEVVLYHFREEIF